MQGQGGFGIRRDQKTQCPQGLSLQQQAAAGVNAWKNQGTPGAKPLLTTLTDGQQVGVRER
jgi:hypothetical protein